MMMMTIMTSAKPRHYFYPCETSHRKTTLSAAFTTKAKRPILTVACRTSTFFHDTKKSRMGKQKQTKFKTLNTVALPSLLAQRPSLRPLLYEATTLGLLELRFTLHFLAVVANLSCCCLPSFRP